MKAKDIAKQPPVAPEVEPLVTATFLEQTKISPKGRTYRMFKEKMIPGYLVGTKRHGIRFRVSEVLEALRAK